MAVVGVYSGLYGPTEYLGIVNCVLIVLQLVGAGVIIVLMDELLQKGSGLGNAVSLFISANIFGQIVWECLSFSSIQSPEGNAEF